MKTYPYPDGNSKVKWISTEWLAENNNEGKFMILDVQPNVHDYIMGHLPGAVYLNEGLLRSASNGLPAMYVPPDTIQSV